MIWNQRNQTIPECDQTLFQMASQFENYWWEVDNVTELCGGNCSLGADEWSKNVNTICDDQYYSSYGKMIPATSIAGRFLDGIDIACLYSS